QRARWLSWCGTTHSARPVAVRPHEGRRGRPRYLCTLSRGWLPAGAFLRAELRGEGRRRCGPRICGIARHGIGGEAPTRRADRDALCFCLRALAGRALPAAISLRGLQRRRTGSPRLRWLISHIAGSARSGDFNSRFARPNGLGFFVASLFPYLDLDQHDPVTGKTDGILMKLGADQRPKIFYTNSSG